MVPVLCGAVLLLLLLLLPPLTTTVVLLLLMGGRPWQGRLGWASGRHGSVAARLNRRDKTLHHGSGAERRGPWQRWEMRTFYGTRKAETEAAAETEKQRNRGERDARTPDGTDGRMAI